jgi:hypothetical protein
MLGKVSPKTKVLANRRGIVRRHIGHARAHEMGHVVSSRAHADGQLVKIANVDPCSAEV